MVKAPPALIVLAVRGGQGLVPIAGGALMSIHDDKRLFAVSARGRVKLRPTLDRSIDSALKSLPCIRLQLDVRIIGRSHVPTTSIAS